MTIFSKLLSFAQSLLQPKKHYCSYVHNPGNKPLLQLTLGKLLENAADLYGHKTALISVEDDRRYSFKEVFEESRKLAAGFYNLGLQNGDRIGLWSPNIIEFVTTLFAAAQVGLVTVSLNPMYQEQDLHFCFNKVGIKALVCPENYDKIKFFDTLTNLLPELIKSEPGKLNSQKIPSLKSVIAISKNFIRGTYNYTELIDNARSDSVESIKKIQPYIQSDGLTNIQYTSGTTGKPKAACLTHFQMINNSYVGAKRLKLNEVEHNICIQVPFFHAFGITYGITAAQHFGTTLTLPTPIYNSAANLKAIEREKCTMVYGTTTMFIDLINLQLKENRNINVSDAFCGASPCSPQLFQDIRRILKTKTIHTAYGLTEATAVAFQTLSDEETLRDWNTVGYIGEHLEAKVVDSNNNIVPTGTPGELCIRGYSVMNGYWDDENQSNKIIGKDKWLKTGDQFILQKNGYGKIVGRIKDVIIRGGENIFPKEIEDVLNTHPDILETYVIGLSHNRLGEEICACIKFRSDAELSLKSMVKFCEGKLTSFKIPSQIRVVEEFPKTASGKIQKNVLKQRIEAEN